MKFVLFAFSALTLAAQTIDSDSDVLSKALTQKPTTLTPTSETCTVNSWAEQEIVFLKIKIQALLNLYGTEQQIEQHEQSKPPSSPSKK